MAENSEKIPIRLHNPTRISTAGWNWPSRFFIRGNRHCILSPGSGIHPGFRIASAGCIIASFILAYLAWIRPKKDIVALTTPMYSIIFFVLPSTDTRFDPPDPVCSKSYHPAGAAEVPLWQTLYSGNHGKELGGSLKTYIDQTGNL